MKEIEEHTTINGKYPVFMNRKIIIYAHNAQSNL
jgi:hypothetical protein